MKRKCWLLVLGTLLLGGLQSDELRSRTLSTSTGLPSFEYECQLPPLPAGMMKRPEDSPTMNADSTALKSTTSESLAEKSEGAMREMKPEFTATQATFHFLLDESAVIEIRLFDSRGASISSTIRKTLPAGNVMLEIPLTMPNDKEIVYCVKVNGKKTMKNLSPCQNEMPEVIIK